MTQAPCPNPDCGLLHDDLGLHAPKGYARGSRRALFHHTGECPAHGGIQHAMAICPLLSGEEKVAIRTAADVAMKRDGLSLGSGDPR